jgi:hypothetical protein
MMAPSFSAKHPSQDRKGRLITTEMIADTLRLTKNQCL